MILSLSISASSYNSNFIFLLKSRLHTLFSVLNMFISITRTMYQLAPNLLLIFQISAKKHHSLSNTNYRLSKFIYLSLIAFNMLILLNYLCNYCINIYLTHHTVDSMKIGPPFSPPLNTNTLAATMNRLQQCFVIMAIIPIQFTSNSKEIKPLHSKNSSYRENSHKKGSETM